MTCPLTAPQLAWKSRGNSRDGQLSGHLRQLLPRPCLLRQLLPVLVLVVESTLLERPAEALPDVVAASAGAHEHHQAGDAKDDGATDRTKGGGIRHGKLRGKR